MHMIIMFTTGSAWAPITTVVLPVHCMQTLTVYMPSILTRHVRADLHIVAKSAGSANADPRKQTPDADDNVADAMYAGSPSCQALQQPRETDPAGPATELR